MSREAQKLSVFEGNVHKLVTMSNLKSVYHVRDKFVCKRYFDSYYYHLVINDLNVGVFIHRMNEFTFRKYQGVNYRFKYHPK